jgi:hypothetical protein
MTQPTDDRSSDATRWVPIREAARLLGVSPDTVRRRIKRGELDGELVAQGAGQIWLVNLPKRLPQALGLDAAEYEQKMAWLRRDLELRDRELDAARAEIEYLRGLNLHLLDGLRQFGEAALVRYLQ